MVTEERRTCVEQFLARVCAWSLQRPDVVAVALVGSWACGQPGMDSAVDLVVLTTDKPAYLHEESWGAELGGTLIIRTRNLGPPLYTERRFVLPSGLEVEFGVAPPAWAAVDPSIGGLRALHDPGGVLARVVEGYRGDA
jgi:uncharacterized protein